MKKTLYTIMALALVLAVTFAFAAPTMASEIGGSKTSALSAAETNEFYPGDTIYYTMTVSNPVGNPQTNTLTRIWDTLPNGVVIEFLDPGDTLVQAPGDVATFTAEYVVDWDDAVWDDFLGYYVAINVFQATGRDSQGDTVNLLVERRVQVLEFAELGDFVWHDLNADGIQNAGEPGIAGVTVNLWSANETTCEPIAIIATNMTDAIGYYLFDELRAGKYLVQFVLPDGDWVFSPQFAGNNTAIDSNADPATGISDCVELAAGDSDMTIDAGMYELFEELTIDKTVVTSYTRTHDWSINKTVETENEEFVNGTPKIWLYPDESGDESAKWTVCATYLGYEDSGLNVSGNVTIYNSGDLAANITSVEDLLCGDAITVDFGVSFPYVLAKGATLTGTYSVNVTEMLLDCSNNVTVTTTRDQYGTVEPVVWGDPDEEIHASVDVTDTNDGFFDKYGEVILDADDYQAGAGECYDYTEFFAWGDYDDPDPASWQIDNIARVSGDDGALLDEDDATLKINWITCELGDFVWNDLNRDGIQDAGEPGIANVTVNLWSADATTCDPIAIIDTTTTDADGYYLFDELMPGKYLVQFLLPDGGWVFSPQFAGADPAIDSNADPATGISDCVELAANESNLTIDAGMYMPVERCWGDDTAWAFGGEDAKPNWNYVNNRFWGWTNGPLSPGFYAEWPLYAGAAQNDLDKGDIVGTVSVNYTDGCVTVIYDVLEGYYIGEAHLWVGSKPLPEVTRGRTKVYTNAPGQFPYGTHKDSGFYFNPEDPANGPTEWSWTQCGFKGDIYIAAHAVVWMEVECPEEPIA